MNGSTKKDIRIPPGSEVTVITAGNTLRIQYLSRENHTPQMKKLSNGRYLHLGTGEIIISKKKPAENRMESVKSLKKTFQKLGLLIQANTSDVSKVRWVTLTYAENMTDAERLYLDYKRFYQRLRTYCRKMGWEAPEYISVVEPQARGAWHLHVFLIWLNTPAPFLPNADLSNLWGHGFTKITSLKQADNAAGYLIAYLTDLESNAEQEKGSGMRDPDPDVSGESMGKKVIKGGRLSMYPAGMNIYRHSTGIRYPVKNRMLMWQASKLTKGLTPVYTKYCHITTEDGFESDYKMMEYRLCQIDENNQGSRKL